MVAGLAVVALAAAACGYDPDSPQQHRMDAVCTRVQAGLARRDDVVWVQVSYAHNVTSWATAYVDIGVDRGVVFGPVMDAAAGAVWRSGLTPLSTIDVSVREVADPTRGRYRSFLVDQNAKDTAAFEARYGPGPVAE